MIKYHTQSTYQLINIKKETLTCAINFTNAAVSLPRYRQRCIDEGPGRTINAFLNLWRRTIRILTFDVVSIARSRIDFEYRAEFGSQNARHGAIPQKCRKRRINRSFVLQNADGIGVVRNHRETWTLYFRYDLKNNGYF